MKDLSNPLIFQPIAHAKIHLLVYLRAIISTFEQYYTYAYMSILAYTKVIVKNLLLRGILPAIALLVISNLINLTNFFTYFSMHTESELSTPQIIVQVCIVLLSTVGYFFWGLFWCLKAIYNSVYQLFIQPHVPSIVERCMRKIETTTSTVIPPEGFVSNLLQQFHQKIQSLPNWIRKTVNWLLNRVRLDMVYLQYLEGTTLDNESELTQANTTFIEDFLGNFMDRIRPFWMVWLFPIHFVLSVLYWWL